MATFTSRLPIPRLGGACGGLGCNDHTDLYNVGKVGANSGGWNVGKTGVLGSFEEMVLLSILHNGANAYAVTIRRELADRSGSNVSMGAVYATLDRLEEKALVDSTVRLPEGAVGRPRRYYRILALGLDTLVETRDIRGAMWQGLSIDTGRAPG